MLICRHCNAKNGNHYSWCQISKAATFRSVACPECKQLVNEGAQHLATCSLLSQANRNHHAIHNLETALETYRKRNKVYGNNYKRFGAIMMALYPKGVHLETEGQWNRFGIIIQLLSKLSRYVTDPLAGHMDSIHDLGVYAFMLEELDAEQLGLDVTPPEPLKTTVEPKDVLPNPCPHVYRYSCEHSGHAFPCNGAHHICGKPHCVNCGEERES